MVKHNCIRKKTKTWAIEQICFDITFKMMQPTHDSKKRKGIKNNEANNSIVGNFFYFPFMTKKLLAYLFKMLI